MMLQHRADRYVSDIRLAGATADVGAHVCSSDESIRKTDQVTFWPHSHRELKKLKPMKSNIYGLHSKQIENRFTAVHDKCNTDIGGTIMDLDFCEPFSCSTSAPQWGQE